MINKIKTTVTLHLKNETIHFCTQIFRNVKKDLWLHA